MGVRRSVRPSADDLSSPLPPTDENLGSERIEEQKREGFGDLGEEFAPFHHVGPSPSESWHQQCAFIQQFKRKVCLCLTQGHCTCMMEAFQLSFPFKVEGVAIGHKPMNKSFVRWSKMKHDFKHSRGFAQTC